MWFTIIDILFLKKNKKVLKQYHSNEDQIIKTINKQYKMYTTRGRGLTKYLFRYIYKPLTEHYELALEAIRIEQQIKFWSLI